MRILYIFPHPDDESFGPAGAISLQSAAGHKVFLLTLTRGGATKERLNYGYSVEEMGQVRVQEMQFVKDVLGISDMRILDFPDSGLSELDPRVLEQEVERYMQEVQPQVVITYPVHGGSGYHDHLVTHAVVKRTFLSMQSGGAYFLRRLAFFTMPDSGEPTFLPSGWPRLKLSAWEQIDCTVPLSPEAVDAMKRALTCYATYQNIVQVTGVVDKIGNRVHFEIFGEEHDPPLTDLTAELPTVPAPQAVAGR